MLKIFFSSLSKSQTIVIVALILIALALLIPKVPSIGRWFNSATSEEYEPWNPENINVIKNNIERLNIDAEDIKFQLDVLPAFEQDIALNKKTLDKMTLDSSYNNTVAQMQPNKMIGSIESYYEVNPESSALIDKKLNKSLLSQIDNKRQQYTQDYMNMLAAMGFDTNYLYSYNFNNKNYISIYPSSFFIAAIRSTPVKRVDTTQRFIETFPPKNQVTSAFTQYKSSLQGTLYALDSLLLKRIALLEARKQTLTPSQEKLKDDFNKKNFNINQYAVVIGIPFFIIAALLMYWYGLRSNKESNAVAGNVMNPKDKLAFALNTITVLILILSLLILGLAKVISENALAALLGTIGGYVLNNAKTKDGAPVSTINGDAIGTTVITSEDNKPSFTPPPAPAPPGDEKELVNQENERPPLPSPPPAPNAPENTDN
jgi:hypothetical protein